MEIIATIIVIATNLKVIINFRYHLIIIQLNIDENPFEDPKFGAFCFII